MTGSTPAQKKLSDAVAEDEISIEDACDLWEIYEEDLDSHSLEYAEERLKTSIKDLTQNT